MALSTVPAVLKRSEWQSAPGSHRPSRPSLQAKAPGELVQLDIKMLERIAGAGHRVTRRLLALSGVRLPRLASFGITIERVLSDNGPCYRSRAHASR